MPKNVLEYTVLIASPSDVMNERRAIRQTIHNWNASVGQALGVRLEPVMWETHTTPEQGERPQAIINRQIVDDCDILVGVFWTRLGSPTGVAASGTVEEIGRFVEANKPALIYFSSRHIPMGFDLDQYKKLLEFKSVSEAKGLHGSFGTVEKLRTDLHADLTRTINRLHQSTTASQENHSERDSEAEGLSAEEGENEVNTPKVPFEALSMKDIRTWLTRAAQSFMEQGVPKYNDKALRSMAEGLYRASTRSAEDLRREFIAGQRASMRQERGSEDAQKAASRLPKDGKK